MKKDIKDILFWVLIIVFVFFLCFQLCTSSVKNIRMLKHLKENDICIEIHDEIYCRLDYDIIINEPDNL